MGVGQSRTHCECLRARPASRTPTIHIDPAHVDVWIHGAPVALDAGTFRYCAAEPWKNALCAIEVHNTVSIPSLPAAVKGPRFLWLSRPRARVVGWQRTASGGVSIELLNDSWAKSGIVHRRRLELGDNLAVVADEIQSRDRVDVALHWLIPDDADSPAISVSTDSVTELIRGSETDVFGWFSPEYARKLPALSLRVRASTHGLDASEPLRFVTTFAPSRQSAAARR